MQDLWRREPWQETGFLCQGEEWQYSQYPPDYAGFIPGEGEVTGPRDEVMEEW